MGVVGTLTKQFNPREYEERLLKWWDEARLRDKAAQMGRKKFYFLDGPPYVTNPIHVGTAWNKILKDAYLRFHRMIGLRVRDQPGFDMHGLPIEVMVEKKLGIKSKKEIETKIGIKNFVEECRRYALDNLKIATNQFKNLGVWMDWEHPYMTITNEYIEAVWWMIKKAEEKGLLSKGLRVTHTCPRCETVLAGYEVTEEYRELEDPSIYVKFPVKGRNKEYILIWTTTPWTLPANVAVMVHPDYIYIKAKVEDEVFILAEERASMVLGENYEVLERLYGSELEGVEYTPPLLEEVPKQAELKPAHMVVLSSEYVTLEEGTGCVHSAPGHGEEDFEVGMRYGLPVFCPVNEAGRFTKDGGKYQGMYVRDANPVIVEDLKRKGLLFKEETIRHRYPHCWRCKTPLVLRATEQWFLKVTEIKEKLLDENERVNWIPEWAGKSRFGNWIRNARDWVISRQRYWGIPLPIWICEKCGKRTVVGSIEELLQKAVRIPAGEVDLHRPWVDEVVLACECGGEMRRVPDVVDVWMDSGAASWASLAYPKRAEEFEKWWPVDLILEGHDQTRGWFYTLMVCGVIAFDSCPYRTVLMHGFTLDQYGRAMHKSLGNVIYPEEVIEKLGRDVLRIYELQHTTWEDLRFTWRELEEVFRQLNIVWNTYYFASLYMNLDRFDPEKHHVESLTKHLKPEDRWLLSKFQRLIANTKQWFAQLQVFNAAKALMEFLVEDVSRWYIRAIRRRTWIEAEAPEKLAAYATLYEVLYASLRMLAPIAPFITEEIYQKVFLPAVGAPESIHLLSWPEVKENLVNEELERQMKIAREIVEAAASARQRAGLKLRIPLRQLVVVSESGEVEETVKSLRELIADLANVKEVVHTAPSEEARFKEYKLLPRWSKLGPAFKAKAKRVAEALSTLPGREVVQALSEKGAYWFTLDGEEVVLLPEHVEAVEEVAERYSRGEFSEGRVYVDIEVTPELAAEGLAREMVRRIQEMRKEMDLEVDAKIYVTIVAPDQESVQALEKFRSYIMEETRAEQLSIAAEPCLEMRGYCRDWDIDGDRFTIAVERAER